MDGSEASVRNLLDQVCRYMDINPNRVTLELFTNKNELWLVNDDGNYHPTGAAGLYDEQIGKTVIHIETSEMMNLNEMSKHELKFRETTIDDLDVLDAIRLAAFSSIFQSFRDILGQQIYSLAQDHEDEAQSELLNSMFLPDSDWSVFAVETPLAVVGFSLLSMVRFSWCHRL